MHPSYININCNTSFCYYNHEDQPNFKPTNSSHNNQKFVATDASVDDQFNSPVILEANCVTGKNRTSKKDRHSKINTARGLRDRRMRLSLDVAKKFFSLQDMLGFDKASKTVEWLLMKSKPAIRDLHLQQLNQSCSLLNSPSSASECEVLSGIDVQLTEKPGIVKVKAKLNCCRNKLEKKRVERVRKSVYIDHSLAKESREKARARARKRTNEKRCIKLGYEYSTLRPNLDQNTNRLGFSIPLVENLTDQPEYPSSHFQFKQWIVGDISSSLMSSSNWNSTPSFFSNYQHNPGLSHDQHQLSDLQILGGIN